MNYLLGKISDASKLLNIPVSTLKFWSKKGLLPIPQNKENGYRQFDIESLIKVGHIHFYRSLGLSIKEIPAAFEKDFDESTILLDTKQQDINKLIQELHDINKSIEIRKACIDEIKELSKNPYVFGEPDFEVVNEFDDYNPYHLQRYVDDNTNAITVGFFVEGEYIKFRGLLGNNKEKYKILWKKSEGKKWIECITSQNAETKKTDKYFHLDKIKEMGFTPKTTLEQFKLLASKNKTLYHYYKMWVEVE